jgi:hypothetical protein
VVNVSRKSAQRVEAIKQKLARLVYDIAYDICSMRSQRITVLKKAFATYASGSGMSANGIRTMARLGYSANITAREFVRPKDLAMVRRPEGLSNQPGFRPGQPRS